MQILSIKDVVSIEHNMKVGNAQKTYHANMRDGSKVIVAYHVALILRRQVNYRALLN